MGSGADHTKAKVFISHSGWGGIVEDVVRALERAFGEDFEMLIDRSKIRGGDDVKERVDEMIWGCDAAVVIVDPKARDYANNPWVYAEAAQLRGRRTIQVIPLLVGGVTREEIKLGWEATGLDARRALDNKDVDELATEAVRSLAPTLSRVRSSKVNQIVAGILDGFAEVALGDVESASGAGKWSMDRAARNVAAALLEPGEDGRASYPSVMKILGSLAEFDHARAARVLDIVIPFTWVNPEVARQIPNVVGRNLIVALGARQVSTSDGYVHCSGPWPRWKIYPVDPAADTECVELPKDVDQQLARIDEAHARAVEAGEEPVHLIVLVCGNDIDPEAVRLVQERIDERTSVYLVLLVGDVEDNAAGPGDGTMIKFLKPKVSPEDEELGCTRLTRARDLLRDRAIEAGALPPLRDR